MKRLMLRDAVAVVTGAASGIGRATALALAGRGAHLALVDRNGPGLEETAAMAEGSGVRASRHHLDVADPRAVAALPDAVMAAHGRVTVLVNNAGVALVGKFEELSMEEFRWLFEINLFAVVSLTHTFLPLLRREPAAQVANVSSLFGIIAPVDQSAYSASKFAVRGFSEVLRHELDGTTVGVTVIHPGGVRTGIARSARVAASLDPAVGAALTGKFAEVFLRMPPDRAGEAIVRAIERRAPRLLIGADAKFSSLLQRLMPARYWNLLKFGYARLSRDALKSLSGPEA
jgi:short-subunit dehydrogenase